MSLTVTRAAAVYSRRTNPRQEQLADRTTRCNNVTPQMLAAAVRGRVSAFKTAVTFNPLQSPLHFLSEIKYS